jgi:hypothetical protein
LDSPGAPPSPAGPRINGQPVVHTGRATFLGWRSNAVFGLTGTLPRPRFQRERKRQNRLAFVASTHTTCCRPSLSAGLVTGEQVPGSVGTCAKLWQLTLVVRERTVVVFDKDTSRVGVEGAVAVTKVPTRNSSTIIADAQHAGAVPVEFCTVPLLERLLMVGLRPPRSRVPLIATSPSPTLLGIGAALPRLTLAAYGSEAAGKALASRKLAAEAAPAAGSRSARVQCAFWRRSAGRR